MVTSNYSDEFKRDAVQQITVRGYPVREVSSSRSIVLISAFAGSISARPCIRSLFISCVNSSQNS